MQEEEEEGEEQVRKEDQHKEQEQVEVLALASDHSVDPPVPSRRIRCDETREQIVLSIHDRLFQKNKEILLSNQQLATSTMKQKLRYSWRKVLWEILIWCCKEARKTNDKRQNSEMVETSDTKKVGERKKSCAKRKENNIIKNKQKRCTTSIEERA